MADHGKMRRVKKPFLLIPIFASVCLFGQHNESSNVSVRPLIDVKATHYRIGDPEEYEYLRVYEDGTAEAQVVKREAMWTDPSVETKRTTLPKPDVSALEEFLRSQKSATLQKRYPQRIGYLLDDFIAWDIRLETANGLRDLKIVAFEPDMAKENKKRYPRQVLQLGCLIEKLRAQTIGKSIYLYDECKSFSR